MSPSEAAIIVARFLKANSYDETLDTFIREAGLPPSAGSTNRGDLTIEKILEEKQTFDMSLQFERLGTDDGAHGWSQHAPAVPNEISGPTRSNILHTSLPLVASTTSSDASEPLLVATTADRRLNVHNLPACTLKDSLLAIHDSPVLSTAVLKQTHLLTASMSGQLVVSDLQGVVFDKRRDHAKYVVQIITHELEDVTWLATAGWDGKVHLYSIDVAATNPKLSAPVASISLPTNPEALLFIKHPDNGSLVLIITRRDSTHLFYYGVDSEARLLGKQNLAPHSNAWIAFTPSAIALCPTDSTLIAIATSAIPHMKLLIVRLMVPSMDGDASIASIVPAEETQASQARAALALQDRESAAILIQCNTMAPQTAYSTPALTWRPDGTGVWVNSDDGAIRGIEATTGKIIATLKGHEPGSKVRCLSAACVKAGDVKQEWLVSGGFDHKLIVWKPEPAE
ncbi:WD40 repeat-like protein [Aureobasidium pullulans]|uniref:WD40 repeat-like protein n=1 Tax=Aureobasidium pullulans TaxID=5580 RepID=A0AB74K4T4_AURPU|nr:WD40 repeat-like protein [Aureobasidium pullulans]THX62529.1 WD40 repeat-like protein [Aureobasidium pullulans]